MFYRLNDNFRRYKTLKIHFISRVYYIYMCVCIYWLVHCPGCRVEMVSLFFFFWRSSTRFSNNLISTTIGLFSGWWNSGAMGECTAEGFKSIDFQVFRRFGIVICFFIITNGKHVCLKVRFTADKGRGVAFDVFNIGRPISSTRSILRGLFFLRYTPKPIITLPDAVVHRTLSTRLAPVSFGFICWILRIQIKKKKNPIRLISRKNRLNAIGHRSKKTCKSEVVRFFFWGKKRICFF